MFVLETELAMEIFIIISIVIFFFLLWIMLESSVVCSAFEFLVYLG